MASNVWLIDVAKLLIVVNACRAKITFSSTNRSNSSNVCERCPPTPTKATETEALKVALVFVLFKFGQCRSRLNIPSWSIVRILSRSVNRVSIIPKDRSVNRWTSSLITWTRSSPETKVDSPLVRKKTIITGIKRDAMINADCTLQDRLTIVCKCGLRSRRCLLMYWTSMTEPPAAHPIGLFLCLISFVLVLIFLGSLTSNFKRSKTSSQRRSKVVTKNPKATIPCT